MPSGKKRIVTMLDQIAYNIVIDTHTFNYKYLVKLLLCLHISSVTHIYLPKSLVKNNLTIVTYNNMKTFNVLHLLLVQVIVLLPLLCLSDDFVSSRATYYGSPDCKGNPRTYYFLIFLYLNYFISF